LSMHVETHAAPAPKPTAPVKASPTLPEAAAETADDAGPDDTRPGEPKRQYQADAWNARWDDMPADAKAPAKKAKPPRKPNFRLPAPSVDVKDGLYGNFRGGRN